MKKETQERTAGQGTGRSAEAKGKLPLIAYVVCAWPLVLVGIGGAIGGGLGGAAVAVNLTVYKSRLPVLAKVLLNIGAGFTAIAIWYAIARVIQSSLPSS